MDMSNAIEIFQNRNIVIPLYLFKRIKEFKLETDEFIFLMYLHI